MDSLREALREGVRRMADILCEYGERGEIDRPFIAACSEWQKNAVRLLAAPETWPSEEPTYRWRPSKEDNDDLKKKFGMYFPDCEPKGPVTPDRETPASPTGASERFEEAKLWREAIFAGTSSELMAWIKKRWDELEAALQASAPATLGLEAQAQRPKAIGDKILIYAGKSCWLAEVIQRLDDSAAPASVDARREALEEAAQAVEKYWASLKSQLGDELGKEAAEAIRAIAAKEPR